MKGWLTCFFVLSVTITSFAQTKWAETITQADLKRHLYAIATDSMEGRETGEKGQKMAAEYLKQYFSKTCQIPPVDNLKEGYFQEFPISIQQAKGGYIKTADTIFKYKTDFYYPKITGAINLEAHEIAFLGYGIDDQIYSDYKNIITKGKVGIIFSGVPDIIEKNGKTVDWTANWRIKLELATKKGLKALLVIDENIETTLASNPHFIDAPYVRLLSDSSSDKYLPVFYISSTVANHLLFSKKSKTVESLKKKIDKKARPRSFVINRSPVSFAIEREVQIMTSENVLGFIEGTDKKDELVVITAHYDHLGKHDGQVYCGADDDGSGTVALLELAEAFSLAKKAGMEPRRSILIMPVSGEEKGLLGSSYYSENPIFPLENTVVDLNIDMIGRMDSSHANNPNYIYLIGSDKLSKDLHNISEQANKTYTQLELDYRYNDENDPNRFYYRSDHWNFAKHDIPVIFYFNGVHEDYHKPTDTVDKIHFEKMEKITRLVFYTAWDIANREERIKLDSQQEK